MAQPQQVNLGQMSLEQLAGVKQQLEQEMEQLQSTLMQLQQADAKIEESRACLAQFSEENKNERILVPISNSLYVPGTLNDIEYVIVNVGTGYFIKKPVPKAKEFVERKGKFVDEQTRRVQEVGQRKRKNLEMVVMVMQQRLAEQQQASMRAGGGK